MPRPRIQRSFTAGEISPGALTPTGIVNRALAAIGSTRENREALNQAMLDQMATGTCALHIGIDPAAPNGDMAAIAVRSVAADGSATVNISTTTAAPDAPNPGLTLESLQRARELLDRNMHYGRSPAEEAMTATRILNEQMRRWNTGLPNVEIQFENHHATNQVQVMTRIPELRRMSLLDREQLIPDNFPHIAREAAYEFAQHLERQIMEALIRATEEANRGRYHQNRVWENIRHFADIAPAMLRPEMVARIMTGDEAPEKKGAFDWLKDFKYKTITHNGWTAKVLDTYEAVKAEGRDMGHCLGGAYTKRIADGEYMAVHITAPEGTKLPKSGFTLGFHRKKKKLTYDQLKGKKNDMSHCQHSGLLWFVRMIEEAYTRDRLPADAVVT